MTTVHLVYPHGTPISCPDAIGRNLGRRLEEKYGVIYHNFDAEEVIKPEPGDVLLGHPDYHPNTCFRLSMRQPGWRRVIAMFPYHHGHNSAVAFADSFLDRCDMVLAITGNYWFNSVSNSIYSHWRPKMVHLDLAVERTDFPIVKRSFNPPSKRRFLYIGNSTWMKNPGYLSAIANTMTEAQISWIGKGRWGGIPGVVPLGYHDFSTEEARQLLSTYDFMITTSHADANPTTILESMAWGLIPVCTPESGYNNYPGIVNIPLQDVKKAVGILRELQYLPDTTLHAMQELNWGTLDRHFNWDRFMQQVVEVIESNATPPLLKVSKLRRWRIRYYAFVLPLMRFHPRNLSRYFRFLSSMIGALCK
jgi:glycosyltransferase involved in cell wall biosynthesis